MPASKPLDFTLPAVKLDGVGYFLKTYTARGKSPYFLRGSNGNKGAIVGTATYSGTNTAIASGSHGVMLLPAELSVDANRDGTIVMANDANNPANAGLPVDTTSATQPFRFWVNNDDDAGTHSTRVAFRAERFPY